MISSYDQLTPEALAPIALDDPAQGCHILQSMAGHDIPDRIYDVFLDIVTDALLQNPDPDRAVANLARLADVTGNRASFYGLLSSHPPTARMLLTLLADSQFLADLLTHNPEYLEVITNARIRDRRRPPEELWDDMARRVMISKWPNGRKDALRRFKPAEVLRIASRDLLGYADIRETVRDISDFAEGCVRMALRICAEEQQIDSPPFAVVAMGKLGGRELNYSSDIDLIFVHQERAGFAPLKLAEGIRDALARVTDAGFVFRVDLRLRPEGRFGPISRSVESCRTYYEAWAEPWERQALLKARVVAGDPQVGQAFLDIAEEFVYRRRVEASFVEEIRKNKRRIEEKTAHAGESDVNVKEGIGGVRDPEFAVQLLQLIAGGAHPELRTGSTLEAIPRLTQAGLLTPDEARALEEGYIFARVVEHRLQLMDERPERCIPRAPAELDKFGRRLGYRDGVEFLAEYRARTAATNAVFRRLFYGEAISAPEDSGAETGRWLLDASDPENAARLRQALATAGFSDPQEAETLLLRHVTGNQYGDISPESRENFGRIAGRIVSAAAATEDPLAALRGLEALALSVPSRAALYRSLSESPSLIERFSSLAASGPPLWQIVLQRPELLDLLADDESLEAAAAPPALRKTDPESVARALLRGRLAVGATDLWRLSSLYEAPAQISRFADWAVGIAVAEAGRELGFDGAFAVIGMGKLGGAELGYASDLDVMYVSDPDHVAAATRLAERVPRWLQNDLNRYGFKFEVDARLRPDGRKGNLVLDLETYRKYYETSAATWERQALVKARAVAGDAALGRAFTAMAREIVYERPWTEQQTEEVRAMKRRIEAERLHDPRDLKLGPGGMADIEWTVQLLQLIYGGKRPRLRQTGTLGALRELRDDARITQGDWEILDDAYTRLTQLRNRLFLKRGVAADIPDRMPEPLAEAMAGVREIVLRRFFGR